MHLNELSPDYIPSESSSELLYVRAYKDEPFPGPQYEWLYFGAFFTEQDPPTILIASPQVFTERGKSKRIVIYGDTSGVLLNDEDFQPKLRQTIKELNERAVALMPKQEQTTPPVEQPEMP